MIITLVLVSTYFIYLGTKPNEWETHYFKDNFSELSHDYPRDLEKIENDMNNLDLALSYQFSLTSPLVPEPGAYEAYQLYEDNLKTNHDYISEMLFAKKNIHNYLYYINGVREEIIASSEELSNRASSPMFMNNAFSQKSLIKQSDAYKELSEKNLNIRLDNEAGFKLLRDTKIADFILMIFVFMLGVTILTRDRELGLNSLIATTKNGTKNTTIAKLILYTLISIITVFVVYVIAVLAGGLVFGYGDLSRSIQSIMSFRNAELALSVNQILVIYIAQKLLSILLFVAISTLIIVIFKNIGLQMLAVFLLLTLSFFSYEFIDKYSYLSMLKYGSIYSIFDSLSIWGDYHDVSIFGVAISRKIFSIAFSMLIILISLIISYIVLVREKIYKKSYVNLQILKKYLFKNAFTFEAYRIFIKGFGILLLVVVIGGSFYIMKQEQRPIFTYERNYYLANINGLEGVVDEVTFRKLDEKEKYFEAIPERIQEVESLYEKGSIDSSQRQTMTNKIDNENEQIPTFNRIKDQVYKSRENTNGDKRLYLQDEMLGIYWFEHNKSMLINSILMYLLLIFVINMLFIKDKKYDANKLIKVTNIGHRKLLIKRMLIFTTTAILISLVFYVPVYLQANVLETQINRKILVQSLPHLVDFGANITFNTLFILLGIHRALSLVLAVMIIIFINLKVKTSWVSYLLSFLLLIVPNVIAFMYKDLSILNYLPFANAYGINTILGNLRIYGFVGMLVFNVVMIGILVKVNIRKYTK